MTGAERGFLLLCCALGQDVTPLTEAQVRSLGARVRAFGLDGGPDRDLTSGDLLRLGLSPAEAARVTSLLGRTAALERYLGAGAARGLYPLTRKSPGYPAPLLEKDGGTIPVFFCAGNRALLEGPFVGLAGSRRLGPAGERFARRAGELAAREGYVLVTGGAVGADRAAAEECLRGGGRTITFVPDDLRRRAGEAGPRHLLLSADGYELPFSAARALSRNAFVHKMGEITLIAQTDFGRGGTWRGSVENLRNDWSELYVHDDGSPGAAALIERGATGVTRLERLSALRPAQARFR